MKARRRSSTAVFLSFPRLYQPIKAAASLSSPIKHFWQEQWKKSCHGNEQIKVGVGVSEGSSLFLMWLQSTWGERPGNQSVSILFLPVLSGVVFFNRAIFLQFSSSWLKSLLWFSPLLYYKTFFPQEHTTSLFSAPPVLILASFVFAMSSKTSPFSKSWICHIFQIKTGICQTQFSTHCFLPCFIKNFVLFQQSMHQNVQLIQVIPAPIFGICAIFTSWNIYFLFSAILIDN